MLLLSLAECSGQTVIGILRWMEQPVAGRADILVVPDLEMGTLLVKQLEYLAEGQSADIVVGGRVPIVLTDRADKPLSQLASCALALLVAQQKRKAKEGVIHLV